MLLISYQLARLSPRDRMVMLDRLQLNASVSVSWSFGAVVVPIERVRPAVRQRFVSYNCNMSVVSCLFDSGAIRV